MNSHQPIIAQKGLRIETLSPLHIGTGEQLGVKDYARQGQQFFVAKPEKLLALAQSSPELERAFVAFCEDERQTLTHFLGEQRIRFEDMAAYSIVATGQIARRIPVFIKTAEGKPYLPGSSLKGAVRSALFRSRIISDKALRVAAEKAVRDDLNQVHQQKNPSLPYWRKKIGTDAERSFFGKNEHHDIMRVLHLGDCTAREARELRVAEVRVLSANDHGELVPCRSPRPPHRSMAPITPEVLPKGSELIGSMAFNSYLLSNSPPASDLRFAEKEDIITGWLKECNLAAEDLIQQEVDFFTRHPFGGKRIMAQWYKALGQQLGEVERTDNQCLMHMGGGSGWDAKTVTDQFDDTLFNDVRNTLRLNVGRPRVSRQGRLVWGNTLLPRDDSPKSRKLLFENGQPKEPLGWVRISLEEVRR